ncbi:DUF2635 domain-containing protein [Pseudomonas fluorescens]|uniref:DUF2635 domain-containing protein n=1 Tax=Pseudomonas fluorescens TaxID=294 RepID=A0A5E7Q5G3_PSEFL|nr:DUF2635 domain-containing protein [Pseudomonas fluorescens]VVP57131.1 hypothetical protein PS880_05784 [Pseudomonas fluorescens]
MTTIKLKPAPGCRVRYPDNPTLLLSEDGDQVTLTSAWRRLIKAGDVLEVEPPPPPDGGATLAPSGTDATISPPASNPRAIKRTDPGAE